jgi:hypothetical protein
MNNPFSIMTLILVAVSVWFIYLVREGSGKPPVSEVAPQSVADKTVK